MPGVAGLQGPPGDDIFSQYIHDIKIAITTGKGSSKIRTVKKQHIVKQTCDKKM